jgi:hypothetical protein
MSKIHVEVLPYIHTYNNVKHSEINEDLRIVIIHTEVCVNMYKLLFIYETESKKKNLEYE